MNQYPTSTEMRRISDEHSRQLFAEKQVEEWKALWELIQSSAVEGLYSCSLPVEGRNLKTAQCIWSDGLKKLQSLGFEVAYLLFNDESGIIEVSWADKSLSDSILLVEKS